LSKIKRIWNNFVASLKARFTSDVATKKIQIQQVLVVAAQGIGAGLACSFTLAGLSVAFGPLGFLLGAIGTFIVGWLYQAHTEGTEAGVRWFPTALLAYMALPYFAVVTGYSLIITLLFTGGLIWGLDTLKSLHETLSNRLNAARYAA
jgi:hypothetical protein